MLICKDIIHIIFQVVLPIALQVIGVLISGYIFYLRFKSQKIEFVSLSCTRHAFKGNRINIWIKNSTLKSFFIKSIDLIIKNRYRLRIYENEKSYLLKPMSSKLFKTKCYSKLEPSEEELFNTGKVNAYLVIETEKNRIYTKYNKSTKISVNSSFQQIQPERILFKKHIISSDIKYCITYIEDNKNKIFFISKNGVLSKNFYGFNKIEEKLLNNEQIVVFFKNYFNNLNCKFVIYEFIKNEGHVLIYPKNKINYD